MTNRAVDYIPVPGSAAAIRFGQAVDAASRSNPCTGSLIEDGVVNLAADVAFLGVGSKARAAVADVLEDCLKELE